MGKFRAMVVRPMEAPKMEMVENSLEGIYGLLECDMIEVVYPFEDHVALVCDEEGKFRKGPNRALKDRGGNMYDVVFGTFFVCGIKNGDFASLPKKLEDKYMERFGEIERYKVKGGM